jgi:FlaA1/EpsC-like NDP-sugar epimerase
VTPQPDQSQRDGKLSGRSRTVSALGIDLTRSIFNLQMVLPHTPRQFAVLGHDVAMAALSFVLALLLRFTPERVPPDSLAALYQGTWLLALIAAACFLLLGLHRGLWRYASMGDLVNITKATSLVIVVFFTISFAVDRGEHVPRSVPIIQWFLMMFMIGAPRFVCRALQQPSDGANKADGTAGQTRVPVLLIGAEEGAALLIRALRQDDLATYRAVGILDVKRGTRGQHIHEVPVLGSVCELRKAVHYLARRRSAPQRLVVTRHLPGDEMRKLMAEAEELRLSVSRLPNLTDFRAAVDDGRIELKPIAIEDLLGRPQAELDQTGIDALIEGRRVLVTGAGGSIGSELVRQIADRRPSRLMLLDSSEYNLYTINLEMQTSHPELPCQAILADVRDRPRIMQVLEEARPELVFHAAALKHVPMVEMNPAEGILTNVMGTRNVADATRAAGALAMVQISTDKAVNPTNIMGASKRLAEFYCQACDLEAKEWAGHPSAPPQSRYLTVRFGNVLGSSGSVVPLFQQQLQHGGPLTVTNPEITRYFMTVREAGELVLQAAAHGIRHDEERGQIFVLDMGEPVKIVNVARQMIRLAGLKPDRDIRIKFVGLRPGEKLFEELFDEHEKLLPAVSGVFKAVSRSIELEVLQGTVEELEKACRAGDMALIRQLIKRIIPGYTAEPGSVGEAVRGSDRGRAA